MNFRQLAEHMVALVSAINDIRGGESSIVVGHSAEHPLQVRLLQPPAEKGKTDVRFVLIDGHQKGMAWDIVFCFDISKAQDDPHCVEVEGEDLIKYSAMVISSYLDSGILPNDVPAILH